MGYYRYSILNLITRKIQVKKFFQQTLTTSRNFKKRREEKGKEIILYIILKDFLKKGKHDERIKINYNNKLKSHISH